MKNAFLGRFRRFPDLDDKLYVSEIKTRHAKKSDKITFYRKTCNFFIIDIQQFITYFEKFCKKIYKNACHIEKRL